MDLNLKNKKVFISGGTSGIGLAIVKGFLAEGAHVAFCSRNQNNVNLLINSLRQEYPSQDIFGYAADATDSKEIQDIFESIKVRWATLDILVSNVGDGRSTQESLQSDEQFSNTWKTNFRSAENVVREFLLNTAENAAVIFISSIAGLESFGAPTDYSVAKAAIIALSKNLARKLAPKVRVNCIAPGNVYFLGGSWDLKKQKDPERIQNLIESTVPMKRFGTPEEISDLVLFLSSDRASFITGSCIVIDGGQTVGFH